MSDSGEEYKSDLFLQLCHDEGIERHFTVKKTLQQNVVAESFNRTLLEKIRNLLSNNRLNKSFWVEAMTYASHLINKLPSSAIGGKTLIEKWSGKAATNYDMLRVVRCPSHYHASDENLEPRARKIVFLGFKRGVKGYKLWDSEDQKIALRRDVIFDESSIERIQALSR